MRPDYCPVATVVAAPDWPDCHAAMAGSKPRDHVVLGCAGFSVAAMQHAGDAAQGTAPGQNRRRDGNGPEYLTDGLAQRVLDLHAIFRAADAVSELGDFATRGPLLPQPPCQPHGWQQPDSPPFL
jgi:hypothetical protein